MSGARPRRRILIAGLMAGAAGCTPFKDAPPAVDVRSVQTQLSEIVAPNDPYYQAAVRAISGRDYARALDYLQAARQKQPGDVRVLNAFGVVYDKLGRFDLSARYYSEARQLDPGSPIVSANQVYSALLQGRVNGAAGSVALANASQPVLSLPSGDSRFASPASGLSATGQANALPPAASEQVSATAPAVLPGVANFVESGEALPPITAPLAQPLARTATARPVPLSPIVVPMAPAAMVLPPATAITLPAVRPSPLPSPSSPVMVPIGQTAMVLPSGGAVTLPAVRPSPLPSPSSPSTVPIGQTAMVLPLAGAITLPPVRPSPLPSPSSPVMVPIGQTAMVLPSAGAVTLPAVRPSPLPSPSSPVMVPIGQTAVVLPSAGAITLPPVRPSPFPAPTSPATVSIGPTAVVLPQTTAMTVPPVSISGISPESSPAVVLSSPTVDLEAARPATTAASPAPGAPNIVPSAAAATTASPTRIASVVPGDASTSAHSEPATAAQRSAAAASVSPPRGQATKKAPSHAVLPSAPTAMAAAHTPTTSRSAPLSEPALVRPATARTISAPTHVAGALPQVSSPGTHLATIIAAPSAHQSSTAPPAEAAATTARTPAAISRPGVRVASATHPEPFARGVWRVPFALGAIHTGTESQTAEKSAAIQIANPAKKPILIGTNLVIINASGRSGASEPVREHLVSLQWAAPAWAVSDGARQSVTTIRYAPVNFIVAHALARTLPFPSRLVACDKQCGGVSLILGRDILKGHFIKTAAATIKRS